jgi:hypothetical protein
MGPIWSVRLPRLISRPMFTNGNPDSEEQKAEWRRHPEKYREYRKVIEDEINLRYKGVLRNTAESQNGNEVRSLEPHFDFTC